MMAADAPCWSPGPNGAGDYGQPYHGQGDFVRSLSLNRANSAVDMRQLTRALVEAREGSGQVRDALLSAAFRPRLPGLTKIVSKLSKEGSWRKALEVYETVDELGLRPDTALTNSAISACDKGGRWQKALEIFDRMEVLGLRRDAITYSATISALAKGKQWHAALQVFDHMQAHGVEADVVTCCSLINALERGGQWQLAEKLFVEMCTVQEEEEQLDALVRAAPAVPPGLGFDLPSGGAAPLARSHTSPSSVLLGLKSGMLGGGGGTGGGAGPSGAFPTALPPVSESHSSSELDLAMSLAAQQGIVDALVNGVDSVSDGRHSSVGPNGTTTSTTAAVVSEDTAGTGGDTFPHSLAAAFARVTSLSSPDPSGSASRTLSLDPGMDRALSTGGGASSAMPHNPFAAAAAVAMTTSQTASPQQLSRANTLGSSFLHSSGGSPGLEFDPATAMMDFPPMHHHHMNSSSGSLAPPPSRLQRGSLGRDPYATGPVQAAAAAHLRRAMSCFPDVDGAQGSNAGPSRHDGGMATLTSMFNFSHAARVAPNRVCCNALLAAYARAKPAQWQKALHLLQAMWTGGPTLLPDVVSYNTVLKACANAFQLSKGIEVYQEMRRNGVYPNATTYNCIIAAASDVENAPVMKKVGGWLDCSPLEVQAACMNGYVAGLVKVGLWEEALERFGAMMGPRSPSHPTAATFNTIMAGHMNAGDYPAVRRAFEGMRAAGVSPNIVAFNTLLAALAAMGAWADALDVLRAACAATVEGVHVNTATFNTVLAALAKGAATAPEAQYSFIAGQAVQVYQQMQGMRGGAAPDIATYSEMINILDATGHSQQVMAVHNIMVAEGLSPDPSIASKVLSAAIAMGQTAKAVQIAHSLQLQSVSIDPPQLSALLAACVSAGAWELATQLCSTALVPQGQAASAAMFNYVLRSALDVGQFRTAMGILGVMQNAGLEVEANTAAKILGGSDDSYSPPLDSLNPGSDTAAPPRVSSTGTLSTQSQNTGINQPAPQATVTFKPPTADGTATITNIIASKSSIASGSNTGAIFRKPSTDPSAALVMPSPITPQITSSITPKGNRNSSPDSPGAQSAPLLENRAPALEATVGGNHDQKRCAGDTSGDSTTFISTIGTIDGLSESSLSLSSTNAMLASMHSVGDAAGCLEVLANMKLAGICPDEESYRLVISTLVGAGEGLQAVEVCREGHAAGVLRYLPMEESVESTAGAARVVNLRGCSIEVAATVLMTWLSDVKSGRFAFKAPEPRGMKSAFEQENKHGLNSNSGFVKIVFGPPLNEEEIWTSAAAGGASASGSASPVNWRAVCDELHKMLTTGRTAVQAYVGRVPIVIPPQAVSFAVEGACAVLRVSDIDGLA